MSSVLKVSTIDTPDGTGNIVVSRPLSGSGASLTNLPAGNLTGAMASGVTGVGKLLQIVHSLSGTNQTGTTVFAVDDTIAQITEGDEYYTLAITPASTSNILEITCQLQIEDGGGARMLTGALFNTDSHATNALAIGADYAPTGSRMHRLVFTHVMTAPIASATTFRLRAGAETSGTTRINEHNDSTLFSGGLRSGIIIKEYSA